MIDFKSIEKAMKLMEKYRMQELTLPDGTKLVKSLHLQASLVPIKKPVIPSLVNDPTEHVDVRFAAVLPNAKSDFDRYRIKTVLPKPENS